MLGLIPLHGSGRRAVSNRHSATMISMVQPARLTSTRFMLVALSKQLASVRAPAHLAAFEANVAC